MSSSSLPPLEARVLPDEPPPRTPQGSGWRWLLVCGAFAGFVALFALGLWGLGRLLNRASGLSPLRIDSLVQHWETPEERLSAVREAWEAGDAGATDAELRELARLFTRLGQTAQGGAPLELDELVDLDEMTDRILRHPLIGESTRADRGRVRKQLALGTRWLPGWTEYAIVRVVRSNRDEAMTYTVATTHGENAAAVRWWLKRSSRNWRVCDFERIEIGCSEACRRALDEQLVRRKNGPTYGQALGAINAARSALQSDNTPSAVRQLITAQNLKPPAAAHDLVQLELASVWLACSRPDQVLAACERVEDTPAHPGAHYFRALALAEREDYAEAIQAAVEYRQAAGRHPHLLVAEAQALEALGRTADAARCWQQRLQLTPESSETLAELCRLLAASGQPQNAVAQALSRANQPVEVALSAGTSAAYRHDQATLDAMEQFLREKAPDSAAFEQLLGLRLEQADEHLAAAGHFKAAAERSTDQQEQQNCFEQYLDAMAAAGRAATAYAQADDPAAVFTHFMEGLDREELPITLEDLPRLVALHRERAPDDPTLKYAEGALALADGQYGQAEQLLATAEATTRDDDLRQRVRSKRFEALYRLGRLAEAYRSYNTSDGEAFHQLAGLCQRDRNWPALAELLDLHRQQQATDPWTDYYTALHQQARGDDEAALAAVERAAAAGDDSLKLQLQWLKDDLLVRTKGVAQAYLQSGDQREAFRRLVNNLAMHEDWDGVLELTRLQASTAPSNSPRRSSTIYWEVKAHWNQGQYDKVVAGLTPWDSQRLSRLDGEQLAELCNMLVHSALSLGNIEAAEAAAKQAREEYGNELPELAVALAKNDGSQVRALLSQPRIAQAVFHKQLHREPELTVLLSDPDVADIRRQHAVALPNDYGRRKYSCILFFAAPLSSNQVEASIEQAGPLDGAVLMPSLAGRASRLWRDGAETLVLTVADGPYGACDMPPDSLDANDPLRAAFEQHGGWVAIDIIPGDPPDRNSQLFRKAARLAAALAAADATSCYLSTPGSRPDRFQLIDPMLIQQIASGEFFRTTHAPSRTNPIYLAGADLPDRGTPPWPQRQRLLRQLADRSRVPSKEGHGLVRIRLELGHAAEDVWLKIIRSKRTSNGGDAFFGEMTSTSRLWPHLAPGERVRLSLYDPREIRPVEPGEAN